MATHSSVLAWRIPGTGEPGELPSMGSQSRTRLKRLSSSTVSVTLRIIRRVACNGFEDILNDPSKSELIGELHLMAEYKLGLL